MSNWTGLRVEGLLKCLVRETNYIFYVLLKPAYTFNMSDDIWNNEETQ